MGVRDDLVGSLGPGEWSAVGVPVVTNRVIAPMSSVTELNAQRRMAWRVMMPKNLDYSHPGSGDRGDMHGDTGVLGKPGLHPGGACGWRNCPDSDTTRTGLRGMPHSREIFNQGKANALTEP